MANKEKCNKLSIYLIKEDIEYSNILKEYVYNHELFKDDISETYYYPSKVDCPTWLVNYYNIDIDSNIKNKIVNSRAKVISLYTLLINGKQRVFAIPFGSGMYLLNDDVIEEQFGIKILLNSVDKNCFRKVNISNYGGDHRTKDEQMPKKTDISEFGFDIYNDFLRKATAKSEEEIFSKNVITGGDLFSVSVPVNNENIEDFLRKCYERYSTDKYKENFSWLDNIKEVKEKTKKQLLNNELLHQINEYNFEKVWMAVPEVIEWEKISDFRFKQSAEGNDDVDIQQFIESLPEKSIKNIDVLKNKKVYAISNETDEPIQVWPVYNCIVGEIEMSDGVYCLNYGKWYRVDKDFVQEISQYYNSIPLCNTIFPDDKNLREDEYNEELCDYIKSSILFDKKTVKIKGMGQSSIEVCDVFTNNNELIHVKKNGGSSYLSHLFNQAAVSGEMLLDAEFRKEVNKKFGTKVFDDSFNSKDYKIILGIITKKNDTRPKIPFFSKVSIRYAIDGLIRKGYTVEIKNIFNNMVD